MQIFKINKDKKIIAFNITLILLGIIVIVLYGFFFLLMSAFFLVEKNII